QQEMFAPLVKWSAKLPASNASAVLQHAVSALLSLPGGPVHLDVSSEVAAATAHPEEPGEMDSRLCRDWPVPEAPDGGGEETLAPRERVAQDRAGCPGPVPSRSVTTGPIPADIQRMLQEAHRPLFLIGLGGRTTAIAAAVRAMCESFGFPALVTYKAKGVVPDEHPWFGGVLTNGALEREIMERSDLFLAVGLDPVELLPRPWHWHQPTLSITAWPMKQYHIPVFTELAGDSVAWLAQISTLLSRKTEWTNPEVLKLADAQRDKMRPGGDRGGFLAHQVVDVVAETYLGARATVDAGAHMFPVMSLWPACEPTGILVSNGLSTMGFALPAAIGASLLDRSKPIVAFTGDGGLLMCLGELRTAARETLPLRVIVFDDETLSLIKVKQVQRGYRTDPLSMGRVDWAAIGSGLGVLTRQVSSPELLRSCLRDTLEHPGPVLIAAKISPESYPATLHAARG
ncbi:MAG: thiamine pyrophosphate-dependent enzyme, partial [Terriglobia bacterium]